MIVVGTPPIQLQQPPPQVTCQRSSRIVFTCQITPLCHSPIFTAGAFSPTAVDGTVALKKVYESFFRDYDTVTFTPINPHFRINNSTGISWGHFALSIKPQGAPLQIPVGCYTLTLTETDREWLVVAAHFPGFPKALSGIVSACQNQSGRNPSPVFPCRGNIR